MAEKTEIKNERFRRGTSPPYLYLQGALVIVRLIYEQGGGQASYDVLSRITGNSVSSSSFLKKLAALKMYGLVTESNKTILLTEQGIAIAAPTSEQSEGQAKKAAFTSIDVFSKIYERHKGKLLPVDEFLKNIIEQDALIPRELSSSWVAAFKESARAAGLLFDRADGKTQVLESPIIESPIATNVNAERAESFVMSAPPRTDPLIQPAPLPAGPTINVGNGLSASGNVTAFVLSDGRRAEFNIPFGISSKDAKRLKSYLKGLELIIDAAIEEDDKDAQ